MRLSFMFGRQTFTARIQWITASVAWPTRRAKTETELKPIENEISKTVKTLVNKNDSHALHLQRSDATLL